MKVIIIGRLFLLAVAMLSVLRPSQAANITWDGSTDNDWNTAANWNPANVPNAGGETAHFDGTGASLPDITFNASAGSAFDGILLDGGQGTLSIENTTAVSVNMRTGTGGIVINSNAGPFTLEATGGAGTAIQFILNSAGTFPFTNNSSKVATISLGSTSTSHIITGGGNSGTAAFGGSGNWVVNNRISTPGGSGIMTVTKSGGGTTTFNAASTYTGLTTVTAGTLLANNTTGSATGTGAAIGNTEAVTVAAGATLGGTGIINPTGVAVANRVSINGTLAPGDSLAAVGATTGNLAIGGRLAFETGSTLAMELGGTTIGDGLGTYDQVNQTEAGGTITLDGTVTLSASLINSFTPSQSDVFYILNTNNTRTGVLFNGIAEGGLISLGGGYTGQVTYEADYDFTTPEDSTLTGGDDVAIFNVVPEPSSLAMLLFGSVMLWFVGRKRS